MDILGANRLGRVVCSNVHRHFRLGVAMRFFPLLHFVQAGRSVWLGPTQAARPDSRGERHNLPR